MKKICIALCTLIIITFLTACSPKTAGADGAVLFYYCNSELAYNTADGVISAEIRDDLKASDPFELLIEQYLQGPASNEHINMMSTEISMVNYEQTDSKFKIYLSSGFSELKGIEQTLAGVCLAKTVIGATGAEAVEIYISGSQDNTPVMILDQSNLLLLDECQ